MVAKSMSHHFDTMGKHLFLLDVHRGIESFQAFLLFFGFFLVPVVRIGFRPSTVALLPKNPGHVSSGGLDRFGGSKVSHFTLKDQGFSSHHQSNPCPHPDPRKDVFFVFFKWVFG